MTVDSIAFDALYDLTGMNEGERAPFLDAGRVVWFANGYQSWSPGWELEAGKVHPRLRILKILGRYSLRDGQRIRRGELAGHGIAYARTGDSYVALASVGAKTAPVTFRIDRPLRRLGVDIHSDGAAHEEGELLAEIAVFTAHGYFGFADAITGLYREKQCMARADFLKGAQDRFILAGGWESWYNHYTHIDEKLIGDDLEGLGSSPNLIREYFSKNGRPVVFQVDDGWQRSIGDWEHNPDRFPSGMKALAATISGKGYIPGLWLAPFLVSPSARLYREKPQWLLKTDGGIPVKAGWNPGWEGDFYCLDLSLPEVRGYLAGLFDVIVKDWGFRYLKLDFLYAGMLNGRHAMGGPAFRWYREALEPIVSTRTTRSGKPVAFLGCGAPLESSVGLFPLMRIGADTKEKWDLTNLRLVGHMGRTSAYINLKDTIGRAFMNRALYLSDPDVVFMRSVNCSLTESEKELIAAVAVMFSSQVMISDDVGRFGSPGEAELTRRIVGLYQRMEGLEFGAVEAGEDLWRCFTRDGSVRGIINLRRRPARVAAGDVSAWGLAGDRLLGRAREEGGALLIEPHSVALWQGART